MHPLPSPNTHRYPSFMDALRDLDDPLTMVHLFATLPAENRYEIPRKQVRCQHLQLTRVQQARPVALPQATCWRRACITACHSMLRRGTALRQLIPQSWPQGSEHQ